MKALIISSDDIVINKLNSFFSHKKIETIVYKWLIKALDNIEEIHPEIIIVSSSDYPRHWKTLVQFVNSGIGGDKIKLYLYNQNGLSKEEKSKALALDVTNFFCDLEDSTLEQIFNYNLDSNIDTKKDITTLEDDIELISVDKIQNSYSLNDNIPGTGKFIFTHPTSNKFISGNYLEYNGNSISCDIQDLDIQINQEIKYFSIFDNKICKTFEAIFVNEIEINNKKISIFKINRFYEEE